MADDGGIGVLKMFLGLSRATQAALGLLQLGALARILPAADFALVAASIALAAYFQLLGEPAILGYQRLGHHARVKDPASDWPRTSATAYLLSLSLIVLPLAIGLGFALGSPSKWIGAAVWGLSLMQIRWVSVQYLNWMEQRAFAAVTLVNSATRTLAMIAAAMVWRSGDAALLAGALGSILVTALQGPPMGPISLQWSHIKGLMAVGGPMGVASIAAASMLNWPTVAGSRTLATDAFATYAAQGGLALNAYGTTVGYILVFGFPEAKRNWDDGNRASAHAVVMTYFAYLARLSAIACLAFWFLGDKITGILLGSRYSGHQIPTAVIAIAAITSICAIYGWLHNLHYRHITFASISAVAAVAQIPLVSRASAAFGTAGLLLGSAAIQGIRSAVVVGTSGRPLAIRPLVFAASMLCVVAVAAQQIA